VERLEMNFLRKSIQKLPENPTKENLPNKILKAYAKMKNRAEAKKAKRKQNREWKPQICRNVSAKGQPVSDASQGVIVSKALHWPILYQTNC
jgi:vacuolar-type H+-ATPase catalytic subunit A/Vma1